MSSPLRHLILTCQAKTPQLCIKQLEMEWMRTHLITPQITPFGSMAFCYKWMDTTDSPRGPLFGWVCTLSQYLRGFLLGTPVSVHVIKMCLRGAGVSKWVGMYEWPFGGRVPYQGGSCFSPWAARTGSGHPPPWTRINDLVFSNLSQVYAQFIFVSVSLRWQEKFDLIWFHSYVGYESNKWINKKCKQKQIIEWWLPEERGCMR